MARKTRAKGSMRLYQSYMFRDKDPAIDEFRTLMQDHFGKRNMTGKEFKTVETEGGPTAACVKGWLHGKTKRPQNATLEAAGRALGMRRIWVRHNGKK